MGGHLLGRLGADSDVARVLVPTRRPLSGPIPANAHPVRVDFARMEEHPELFAVDQVCVCLGTTIKAAGSRAAFRAVDHDLVLDVARRSLDAGAEDCLLVSAMGADPHSRVFYSRVKGEAEEAVRALPWRTLAILRPSILVGDRRENRRGERMALALGRVVAPLLVGPLAHYRPIAAAMVAEAMARLARDRRPGTHVYLSGEIRRIAAGRPTVPYPRG